MAYGSLDFNSNCLKRIVSFRIILPNDDDQNVNEPLKLLILLHGYNGINGDWMLNSRVLQLASSHHICVVMPSGENSFYLDGTATGRQYASFVGEELPAYIRKTFPVSKKKEDTWIGGFSMGGFGALHTGLKYPDTFGKIVALSSALIVEEVIQMKEGQGNEIANYDYYRLMFGPPETLSYSENNPKVLIRNLIKDQNTIPGIFMACGTEDFLLEQNREFVEFLRESNVEHHYIEDEGNHNFDFWNKYLEVAVKWLLER